MDLSIVIATWNRKELLCKCLRSLYAHTTGISFEVHVVDNASRDGTADAVRRAFPGVKLRVSEENLGFVRGSNLGIRNSTGRHIALLNNDTELRENAFAPLVAHLDAHPAVGVIGPRLYNPEGTVQESALRTYIDIPSALLGGQYLGQLFNRLIPGFRPFPEMVLSHDGTSGPEEVAWLTGACLLARREVFDRVGLLDENLFMYCEDMEWCYRARQAGWKVVYFPEVGVVHLDHYPSKDSMYRITCQKMGNQVYFYRKYKGPLAALGLGAALCAGSVGKLPPVSLAYAAARLAGRSEAEALKIKALYHLYTIRYFLFSRARTDRAGAPRRPSR